MNEQEVNQFNLLNAKIAQQEANQARLIQATTMFQGEEDQNLVRYQLDIEKELLRIERLLRKQIAVRDSKGNIIFQDNPDNQLFNEKGVTEILNILSWYLSKSLILSCYDDRQINKIMEQFGEELIDFIYTNMEDFGMDTPDKKKHYPMVTMNIINVVDATYRRALNGRELDSLKTARIVNQTEPLGKNIMYPQINKQRFNIINPKTWKA